MVGEDLRPTLEPLFREVTVDASHKRTIVADPERSFGQPIVAEAGVTTSRLAQAVKAEGSVEAAAKLFELRPRLVRDALEYELMHGAKKAA